MLLRASETYTPYPTAAKTAMISKFFSEFMFVLLDESRRATAFPEWITVAILAMLSGNPFPATSTLAVHANPKRGGSYAKARNDATAISREAKQKLG